MSTLRRTITFLVVGLMFSQWMSFLRADEKLQHTKDSLDTVKKNLNDKTAILLDVREKSEWDAGHLEQAKLAPLSKLQDETELKRLVKDVDKKAVIYCHCKAGKRALTAAEILKKQGYDVRPLKQGYDELLKAGLPKSK